MRLAVVLLCSCVGAASVWAAGLDAGPRPAAVAHTEVLRLDAHGGFVVGARHVFLVALSNPPPLTAGSPEGVWAPLEIARAGVNLVRVGPTWTGWTQRELAYVLSWQRVAARLGLRTWVRLNTFAATHPRWVGDAHLATIVKTLTRRGAVAGLGLWQGADEPWSRGIAPRSLAFFYCRLTGRGDASACAGEPPLDRKHLLVTILAPHGSRADAARYRGVSDGLGVDVYPVTLGGTDRDLHRVGRWTRAIAGISRGHFVWTTLQICTLRSNDPHTGRYVLPTAFQERYMLYDALINGARGVSFFGGQNPHCWSRRDRRYRWNWTFWDTVLEPLVRQVGSRSPLAPALANAASNEVLRTSDRTTQAIGRVAHGELWVLAARYGRGARRVAISGLPACARRATAYHERHRVRLLRGTLHDVFRRWQVHVYRVPLVGCSLSARSGAAR